MNIDRKSFWQVSLWCMLLLAAVAGYWTMRKSRNRLQDAHVQLQDCKKLATDIQAMKDQPGFAALGIDSPRTITARAEEASEQADIPTASLVRIEPQPAVRLRDSAYRLRPTRLELRRVTLEQVVAFTHAMIDETQGTTVRDIRLTSFDGNAIDAGEGELWTAEVVLTQLIFAPLASSADTR